MSTEQPQAQANFCDECGSRLTGGRFCPGCGTEVLAQADTEVLDAQVPVGGSSRSSTEADAATSSVSGRPDVPPSSGPSKPSRGGRRPLLLGVVALLVAAAAAAAFLLTSSGGEAEETAYQEKVAAVFGPVLGANRDMATELDRLRGTEPTDARSAVRRARQATTRAEGALAALTVPDGAEELAGDARQVLDREKAYLGALSAVLSNPASPNRSQLETLESNLASAFSEAGPTVAGTDEPVNGANRVTAWAPRASRALKRRAAAKDGQGAATSGGTAAPASNPYSNGRACGDGVYAGPNTSCDFAFNVRDAYNEAPGSTASVRAFSPATGETYTMNCAPSGNGITCSGGNSASVTF